MPYTLAQIEFLGVHFGVTIPPDFLEKKRLGEESANESAETEGDEAVPPGKAAREGGQPAPKIAYAQARLGWDGARKRAQTDVANLEKAFLEMFKADPNFADLQTKIRKLDGILGKFDESLGDTLDQALNAADEEKPKFNRQALAIVEKYRAYVDGDPFIKAVVANPLVPMNFQADLSSTLAQMAQQLAAA
jgi:hypothetical protein